MKRLKEGSVTEVKITGIAAHGKDHVVIDAFLEGYGPVKCALPLADCTAPLGYEGPAIAKISVSRVGIVSFYYIDVEGTK